MTAKYARKSAEPVVKGVEGRNPITFGQGREVKNHRVNKSLQGHFCEHTTKSDMNQISRVSADNMNPQKLLSFFACDDF